MSTTDKYVKKPKSKLQNDGDEPPINEIRLTGTSYVGKYITYAATRLLDKEQKVDSVILKATGVATKGACLVAEILKHRIKNLHQLNEIKTITVVDEYEPLEEGLDEVKIERNLAVLEIHLSQKDGVLDTKAPGYQKPIPESEVEEEDLQEFLQRGGGRGGGRGRGERRGGRGDRREGRGERRGGRRGRGGRFGRRGGRRGERRDDDRDEEGRGERRFRRAERRYDDRDEEGRGERRFRRGDSEGFIERGGRRGGSYRGDRGGRERGRGERRDDRPYERRYSGNQTSRRINQPRK